MKKYIFIAALALLGTLTSCGDKVKTSDTGNTEETAAVTTTSYVTTSTAAPTTTAATTTAVVKTDIPEGVVLTAMESVEVYEDVPILDFITDTNTELKEVGQLIDTSDLGKKKTKVLFEYEGSTYEKEIEYDVVDTTAPVCLNSGWEPYAKLGQPFNLSSIVGYCDNYDRSPDLSYDGEVNTDEVGNYPITVYVTDQSGNCTSWDMTVLVLSEIPRPQDNNPRMTFSDFKDYYCYENVSYGIDVSAWQTNVDYNKVREQGCEFVLMRMGYCYGEIKMDDYYRQNMENATAAGLDVGVYFYTTANTEEKAREQARWIVEQLDGRELDYPVAFDWEEWAHFQQYGMNVRDLNEIFEAFCDELEQNGYTGMLYSSKNFLNNFWTNKNNRTVWLAHYCDETDYTGPFAIWQASAYGRMDGIDGDVDMNIRINEMPV